MPECPNGTERQPGSTDYYWVGPVDVSAWLTTEGLDWLQPFVSWVTTEYYPTSLLCQSEPPPIPTITAEDVLLGLNPLIADNVLVGKLVQGATRYKWTQLCRCRAGTLGEQFDRPVPLASYSWTAGSNWSYGPSPIASDWTRIEWSMVLNGCGSLQNRWSNRVILYDSPAGDNRYDLPGSGENWNCPAVTSASGTLLRGAFTQDHLQLNLLTPSPDSGGSSAQVDVRIYRPGQPAYTLPTPPPPTRPVGVPSAPIETNLDQAVFNRLGLLWSEARVYWDLIKLVQRQSVPFGYTVGTSQTVSGTGEIALTQPLGLLLAVTIPPQYGLAGIAPTRYRHLGSIRLGSSAGLEAPKTLTQSSTLLLPVSGTTTRLSYELNPAVSLTVTQLVREV